MERGTKFILGAVLGVVLIATAFVFVTGSQVKYSGVTSNGVGGSAMQGVAPAPTAMPRDMFAKRGEVSNDMALTEESVALPSSPNSRMIIKSGSLSLLVTHVSDAAKKIADYATSREGFVVSSYIAEEEYRTGAPYGTVTIRVPATSFDAAMQELRQFGEVKSEQVNGQDVTEEFTDLEAQLKNLKATEEQFLSILKQATRIEDILAVQRELTYIRGQIEHLEGRMKYLRESAELSAITVHLSTDPQALPIVDQKDNWKPIGEFKEALRSLVDLGKAFVNGIIWLLVFAPVWLIIIAVIWWLNKKRNMK